MKKLIYSVFALAGILTVSCTKEVEAPVTPAEETAKTFIPYTFKATIGEDTRTAYADNKTFSWKAGDKVDIYTYNETEGYYQISTFEAQEDGVTTTFAGELEDGYAPGPLAVYPDNTGFVNGQPTVFVPSYVIMDGDDETHYNASSDNPLENLVLVGLVNDEGNAYAFKTAMGAVKLTFTDLPEGSCYLRVFAPEKISGYFYIDENGILTNDSAVPGTYTDAEGDQHNFSNHNLWYEFTPASDGSVTLYIPLPVGKLSAGTTFFIEDKDENPLYRRTTMKDIAIERNKVTEVTSLATTYTWESLGTGKFYDRFAWVTGKFTTGAYVDVEIEKDLENPNHYRLVAPYDAAFAKFNYKPNRLATPPDPYLEFFVEKSGYVDYPQTCTGVYYRSESIKESTYLISPLDAYGQGRDRGYNVVARYLEDGVTPANVLIAPSYYWPKSGLWSGDNYYYSSEEIQILFPGVSETVDVSCSASFAEIADDSVEQPIALIDVSFGEHIASAKVIIAQDKAAAKAAAAAGEFGGEATASTVVEVNMPADAESGNYYIYLLPTPAEGLSPALSFLVESEEPFQYVRTDAPDITVEEVVGTYTATDEYVLFNKPYWDAINAGEEDPEYNEEEDDWYYPYTISFTLEESDDEGLGDVMMTAFSEDAVGYCPIETPIYATLEPKSGAITFAPMQPIYSFTNDSTGEVIEVQLANADGFATENLVFELSLDKTTYTSKQYFGYVHYFTEQDGFNYPNIWFYSPLAFLKETEEPATDEPAAAPALKRASILKHLRAEKPGKAVSFDVKPLTLVR